MLPRFARIAEGERRGLPRFARIAEGGEGGIGSLRSPILGGGVSHPPDLRACRPWLCVGGILTSAWGRFCFGGGFFWGA